MPTTQCHSRRSHQYERRHGAAMKVVLFGAMGMVGQGVLRECLRDDGVEGVLAVGRSSTGRTHPKLRELVRKDLFDIYFSTKTSSPSTITL
jgi:dihydrodipicolinate reductase